jgi:hypothetical protein
MSADNWTDCPQCRRRAKAEHLAAEQHLREVYGTVPIEEYEDLQSNLKVLADRVVDLDGRNPEQSLREDYEIYGAEEGIVTVSYRGHCSLCGLGLDFKQEVPFTGLDD